MPEPSVEEFNPILRELGRLLVNFNSAEHVLRRLAWLLIDPTSERAGQVILDGQDAARVEELVRALVPVRLTDDTLAERVRSLVTQVTHLRIQRKGLVHGVWRLPNDSTDMSHVHAALPPRRSQDFVIVENSLEVGRIKKVGDDALHICEQLEVVRIAVNEHLRIAIRGRAV